MIPEAPRRVPLTLAHTLSDRVQALFDGSVLAQGVALTTLSGSTEDIFYRMLRRREFDVAEMSLAAYTVEHSRGRRDLVAIPVFPSRMFRHGSVYVRSDSGLDDLGLLAGKDVGTPDYQMTAGVWVRQALGSDHGVSPDEIRWHIGGLDEPSRRERLEFLAPAGLTTRRIAPAATLSSLLAEGEIDAILSPKAPAGCRPGGPVRRLLRDPQGHERSYYERTGIFPIMHTVVLRREVVDELPWVPQELYRAFVESKRLAWERLRENDYLPYGLVWFVEAEIDQAALFGEEHWPYGVPANRLVLDAFVDACYSQGLTEVRVDVDDLFAPSTVDDDLR